FTDGRNIVGQNVGNGAAVWVCSSLKSVHIVSVQRQSNSGCLANEVLELLVLCNEVGFRVHFKSNTAGAFNSNANQAFCCGTAGLLLSGRKALGAQCVNSSFDVAVSFVQSLLGVHHASAGHFAELLY